MSSRSLYRLSGLVLLIGSLLTIGYQISQAFVNGNDLHALAGPVSVGGSVVGFIGSILVLLGLPGMYVRQMGRAGRLGLIGVLLVWYVTLFQGVLIPFTSVTIVPILVTNPATQSLLAAGPLASFTPFWIPSLVGQIVGIPLLAIATLRAKVFPRWIAWLLIATTVVGLVSSLPFAPGMLSDVPAVMGSLAMVGFGYALLWPERLEVPRAAAAGMEAEARA